MTTDNSSQPPYQACLITVLPDEIQLRVRDFANYVVIPFNILLVVMATICNGFVVFTVARTKSLQQPSLLMLCSLAITDLLYSFIYLFRYLGIYADEHLCPEDLSAEISVFSTLCLFATLGTFAVISRDRYLALKTPYWYRTHVTKSRSLLMICGTWLVCFIISVLLYLTRKSKFSSLPAIIATLSFYVICVFVIMLSYLGVFCNRTPPGNAILIPAIFEREKRMANTVALILLLFLITFLPGILLTLVHAFSKDVKVQATFPFSGLFLQLNSLLNPLVNFGRSKEMRRALRNLLKRPQEVQPFSSEVFTRRQQQGRQ